jgi:proteic killer suppression protein
MIILFASTKLQKECNDARLLVKKHGAVRAKLIQKRLSELLAATVLNDLRNLPQARCHELHGDRKGELTVDVDHPYRLLFEIADDPIPAKPDGGLDWTKAVSVRILGIEDTHE